MINTQLLDLTFKVHGFVGPLTENFDGRRAEILELVDQFNGPPFTIQRICELLIQDISSYKVTHKLIRSLEKLLLVSNTIEIEELPTDIQD